MVTLCNCIYVTKLGYHVFCLQREQRELEQQNKEQHDLDQPDLDQLAEDKVDKEEELSVVKDLRSNKKKENKEKQKKKASEV